MEVHGVDPFSLWRGALFRLRRALRLSEGPAERV